MSTMASALREAVEHHGGKASRDQIRAYISQNHLDRWQSSTLAAHLYACVVNNPKAYLHHPSTPKFLFRHDDGMFELYDPKVHGEIVAPPDDGQLPPTEEAIEVSISLERDLEEHLAKSLASLEPGLTMVERQFKTDVGFIDILAGDKNGRPVVIEIKAGEARDSAIGQITRYLGWMARHKSPARGILVAADFSEGAKYSASVIDDLALVRFQVRFEFERIS